MCILTLKGYAEELSVCPDTNLVLITQKYAILGDKLHIILCITVGYPTICCDTQDF